LISTVSTSKAQGTQFSLSAKGWPTQRAFADACGMNSSHLGQIEQGAGNPRLSTFAHIAEALNMPISELFRGVF
jgi:transcriptional regulator with XRE-family HTH domain